MAVLKRWLVILLALALAAAGGFAAAEEEAESGEFPELNEAGFLDHGEFVFEDEKNGLWRYASSTLWIEIHRMEQKTPARVWYEAEIRCAPDDENGGPRMIPADPENWMKKKEYPYKLARKTGTVLAVTNDYAQLRLEQRKKYPGIVIRNGVVYASSTREKNSKGFPNLDCLAIWPDGDMKVFYSNEKTAEEYLAEGVRDVLCFGPLLIRDGELNEEGLSKYGSSRAERVAVGMVEKGHYYFMMLEGRVKRSKGDNIRFLAEKLLEKGCVVGFNLDGGQTAGMMFMGHQICRIKDGNKHYSSRITCDILGVGYSELLPGEKDPW